ncbi:branched-chain amino acid transport system II carrier protein [Vagococcus lutrae]|uniref:branched-chain amino acid transport system II carrier protein n=1 Tax=Vagococcus lutrae TaxID=81947 RepID=UPI001444197E|nr:branched-chain amino acid transport system II carrier protein [Vagococcus lutrae]NKZ27316.1 branched-chain amino acid transport system II carrier protein [Vagococcus lutrae]
MKKNLTMKQYLTVGSLLFGLFFGAGNLIFPVLMGQLAGNQTPLATIGFIVTGVGLPFLGILAIGFSESQGIYDLASKASKGFGLFFTIALYLTIGPFFALPRTATVSFEVGFAPYLNAQQRSLWLLVFSIIFFLLAWRLSLNPSKMMLWIGKILNPLFLLLLSALILISFIRPMGNIQDIPADPSYQQPFFTGFIEGYNTMDVLAALAFGIIIVKAIQQLGIHEPKQIALDTLKSGIFTVVLMAVIYGSLTFIGATSRHQIATAPNGGVALNQIANYYFGSYGVILLATIITLACLKTAMGLISACSETFHELFPSISYRQFVHLFSLLGGLIANVGLSSIILIATPVLSFLYPLAISLIFLAFADPFFKSKKSVYRVTIWVATIFAVIDALKVITTKIMTIPAMVTSFDKLDSILPLASVGMAWLIPVVVTLCGMTLWARKTV